MIEDQKQVDAGYSRDLRRHKYIFWVSFNHHSSLQNVYIHRCPAADPWLELLMWGLTVIRCDVLFGLFDSVGFDEAILRNIV